MPLHIVPNNAGNLKKLTLKRQRSNTLAAALDATPDDTSSHLAAALDFKLEPIQQPDLKLEQSYLEFKKMIEQKRVQADIIEALEKKVHELANVASNTAVNASTNVPDNISNQPIPSQPTPNQPTIQQKKSQPKSALSIQTGKKDILSQQEKSTAQPSRWK